MSKSDKEKYYEALAKQRFDKSIDSCLVVKSEYLSISEKYRVQTAKGDVVIVTREDGKNLFNHALVVFE